MSRHNDEIRLRHMLDSAREAVSLIDGRSRTDLDTDRLLNLSLTRLLEIIGEAANRVSEDTQNQYSQIPWHQVVSLRNRLIHGYDNVDFDIMWQIVTIDLPALITNLEEIIG